MTGQETHASSLAFKNVDLHFLFTAVIDEKLDLNRLGKKEPQWTIEEEQVDERLFHPRHIAAATPGIVITPPTITIEGYDQESLFNIVDSKESNRAGIYRQLAEEWPGILADTQMNVAVRVFPENMYSYKMHFRLDGEYKAHHLVALINGLLDRGLKAKLASGKSATLNEILLDIHSIIFNIRKTTAKHNAHPFYESYSVIAPEGIKPVIQIAEAYFKEPYVRDLFMVSIRRIEEFREVRMDVPMETQRNLSVYNSDIVIVNYHNMLVYVVDKHHLPVSFYIKMVESLKVMSSLLHHYDIRSFRLLSAIGSFPRGVRRLGRHARRLERTRLDALRALDSFRMLTTVSAFRAASFLDFAVETFRVDRLERSLEHKIREVAGLLTAEYSFRLRRQLQVLALLVGILSLIISIIGIVGIDTASKAIERWLGNVTGQGSP